MTGKHTKKRYVTTTGTILNAIDARLCNVALPNGKVILGHLPRGTVLPLEPDTRVKVRLSVCDFSHGEISTEQCPAKIPATLP